MFWQLRTFAWVKCRRRNIWSLKFDCEVKYCNKKIKFTSEIYEKNGVKSIVARLENENDAFLENQEDCEKETSEF